jgi:2-desacetyl-2-hydroxyethyl bacteriochlorophyllide A dehydrogenase
VRAAILKAPQQVVVSDVRAPEPGPGEVRVKLDGAGICASELPLWQGRDWFTYPRTAGEPGHEGWGQIDAAGPGVEGVELGTRVACISYRAHAEFDVCPAEHLVPVPAAAARLGALPGEPLACAVNALRRANVQPGDRVAVVGCGFLGLLLVQLCAGIVDELAAVSRRPAGLAVARQVGATSLWRSGDDALLRQPPFDVVFEAAGYQEPLDLAGQLVRTHGRLVIAGYHQDGRRSVDMQLWNWRGLDVVNAHERDPATYVTGLREGLAALADGRIDLAPLITHRFGLDELGEAYRISIERPDGFVKAVWCDG